MTFRAKLLLVSVALIVRLLVGWAATGHGEMEGLAGRYEQDAYAISAGYGLIRPVETAPPEVDLRALARDLGARGLRISPDNVPSITPERWRPSGLHPPGYAYYLATVYKVVGHSALYPTIRLLQALLDSFACLAMFSIARSLTGTVGGKIAAWSYAFWLPAAYLATSRVPDAFMPALSIFIFGLWVRALRSRRMTDFLMTGVMIGVASLFRPDFLLLPVYLGIVAVLAIRGDLVRTLTASIATLAAMILILVPWGLRNYAVYGEFKLTSNAAGMTLLQTIAQFPNPYNLPVADEDFAKLGEQAGYDGFDDPNVDRMFKARFIEIAKDDPTFLLKQVLARMPTGLVPLYRWGYTNEFYLDEHSFYDYHRKEGLSAYQIVRQRPLEILYAYWDRLLFAVFSFVLLLACIAVAWSERRRPAAVLMLLVPWIYMLSSHALIYLSARFMVTVAFCQLIALALVVARRVTGIQISLAPWIDVPKSTADVAA